MNPKRLASLDQFRGFAVIAMIAVDVLGHFNVMPDALKHATSFGLRFADIVLPLFVFIVGVGFRMSLTKKIEQMGLDRARILIARRYLFLVLIGLVLYSPYSGQHFWYDYFRIKIWDALVIIGLTGLLANFLAKNSALARIAFAFLSLAIFQIICALTPYGVWLMKKSIDGGPLGFLAWIFVMLMGTLIPDHVIKSFSRFAAYCLTWGVALITIGLVLSSYWEFSKRYATSSYIALATGISFLAFLAFHCLNDKLSLRLPHLSVFGRNALVVYIFHQIARATCFYFVPGCGRNATAFVALSAFFVIYLMSYGLATYCEKHNYKIPL